jgi:hypothetical protein
MIQHKANGREFLIVEVEQDAADFKISSICNLHYHHSFESVGEGVMYSFKIYTLPPGEYTILFIAEEVTEEQAAMVVTTDGQGYWVYDSDISYCAHLSSKNSLQSLIRANFPDTTKKHLIIEKIG